MIAAPLYADISVFQPEPAQIDWRAYKAWARQWDGISRIALRSTYGTGSVDGHYHAYRAAAEAAGIDMILHYHYAYPSLNPPRDEARYQYSVVGAIRPRDLLMLDYEEQVVEATSSWALAWLLQQETVYGRLPALYTSPSNVQARLQDSRLARYPLILASWTRSPNLRPACPWPWSSYLALQYTDQGSVPGIAGPVDLNVYLGGNTPMTKRNSKGMIADYPETSQFDPNETEFACGFFAAALNKYAGKPGAGPTGTASQVDTFADNEYRAVYGSIDAGQTGGISIPQLHTVLQHAGLHYFDIAALTPTSTQDSDLARITAALDAGYVIISTVVEASVRDITGDIPPGNPYSWYPGCDANSCPTHVITYVGHGPGYLLVVDPANIIGPLQGANQVRPWPRKYDSATMQNLFATIVQLPWLAPIPSGDPTSWATGFSGQAGGGTSVQLYTEKSNDFASWFTVVDANQWKCKQNGCTVGFGIRGLYQQLSMDGQFLPIPGLPQTNEITLTVKGVKVVVQIFERLALCYDPSHVKDRQPTLKDTYLLKLNDPDLLAAIPGLTLPTKEVLPAALVSDVQAIQTAFGKLLKDAGV